MEQIGKRLELGGRWLICGWRLFLRNPWLFGGMGLVSALLVQGLALIPFLGGPIVALFAPILLASVYLAIENLLKHKAPLPAALRWPAFMQAPRELVGVFRDEKRVIPMVATALYCMVVALLADVVTRLIAGGALARPWSSLDLVAVLAVLAATLVALAIYFLLAASLIYALPLAFLQNYALGAAIGRSFKAGMHYAFALLALFAVLLLPLIFGRVVAYGSVWAAYIVQFIVGALVLPVVAIALYCSYRTVFPTSWRP